MSKTQKLFEKLMSGANDANVSFDDLCSLLTKLGYTARKTKGSHHHRSTRRKLPQSAAQHRRQKRRLIRFGKSATSCKD